VADRFKVEFRDNKGRLAPNFMRGFADRLEKAVAKGGINRIMDQLVIGANDIRNEMITSMRQSPATGKKYTGGRGGKSHIASSPGNPPRVDSGQLINSIVMDERFFEVEVGSRITEGDPPYPTVLEFGNEEGTLKARPWAEPAFENKRLDIEANLIDAVNDTLRRAVD
jgi:hypothetical protein